MWSVDMLDDGRWQITRSGVIVAEFANREQAEEFHDRLWLAMLQVAASEPYGDVSYADPGYQKDGKKRYPIDSEEHVRAAWGYINHVDNVKLYTPQQVADIKGRIRAAAKKLGVEISH